MPRDTSEAAHDRLDERVAGAEQTRAWLERWYGMRIAELRTSMPDTEVSVCPAGCSADILGAFEEMFAAYTAKQVADEASETWQDAEADRAMEPRTHEGNDAVRDMMFGFTRAA